MEIEKFCSGYCRQLDASRMVAVTVEDGRITDVDCNFGNCPYETNCALAKNIQEAAM